jgi:hypothetical protein
VKHNAAGVAQLNQQQGRWQQEEPITLKAPEEEHGNAPDGMQKDGGHLKPVAGEWGVTKSCLRLESLRRTGTDHSNPTGMTDEKRISLSIRQDKRNFWVNIYIRWRMTMLIVRMSKMQLLALTHAKKHPVSNGKLGQPSSTSKKLKRPASHQFASTSSCHHYFYGYCPIELESMFAAGDDSVSSFKERIVRCVIYFCRTRIWT